MNKIPNRQVVCDTLMEMASMDRNIVVLTSDSRGSASMANFAKQFPQRFIEVGIAEQNIVGIAAGLAASGKKPYVASPACFLSMRSIEQVKVDVAYSGTNVKLIGISGGVSYGALGMSHHSLQDIAVMRAIPGINIILPADRHETKKMMEALVKSSVPAYIRIGRNPVPDVYKEDCRFEIGRAVSMSEGKDITIIAAGETVKTAVDSAELLALKGVGCRVLNMHTLKPLDEAAVIKAAEETGHIITVEEHSAYGGLGAAVSQVVVENCPIPMKIVAIPDEPAIPGKSEEIFDYYGLSSGNICKIALDMLGSKSIKA
jgi:transketolase